MKKLLSKELKEIINQNHVYEFMASHFKSFLQKYNGNTAGLKIATSVKDLNGNWHETTMRFFKNGSIHIKNT